MDAGALGKNPKKLAFAFRTSMLWLKSKPYIYVSGISVVIIVQSFKMYQSTYLVDPDLIQSLIFSSFLYWPNSLVENSTYSVFLKHLNFKFKNQNFSL